MTADNEEGSPPSSKGKRGRPTKSVSGKNQEIEQYVSQFLSGNVVITFTDNEDMWIYAKDKGFFVPNAEGYIKKFCANNIEINDPSSYHHIILNLKGKTMCDRKIFNPKTGFVNLKNGVLELSTGKLLPNSPEYQFKNRLEVNYDPAAKCPLFEKFLSETIPLEKNRALIQEWFGYHFIPGQDYQVFLILFGVEKSGKSLLLNILTSLLGIDQIGVNSLKDFEEKSSHAQDYLYGKLANIYPDMGNEMIKEDGALKMLTTNDPINARPLYSAPFQFRNDAKMTFSTNALPPLSARVLDDAAFWRRAILIEYTKQIENVDIHLLEKILPELPGILNWAIEGLQRLQKNACFTGQNATDSYMTWNDAHTKFNPLYEFDDLFFQQSIEGSILAEVVWEQWETYSKISKMKMTPVHFQINMKRLGYKYVKRQILDEKTQKNIWKNFWEGIESKTIDPIKFKAVMKTEPVFTSSAPALCKSNESRPLVIETD